MSQEYNHPIPHRDALGMSSFDPQITGLAFYRSLMGNSVLLLLLIWKMKAGAAILLCSHVKKKELNSNEQETLGNLQLPLKEELVAMATICLYVSHINYF